MVRLSAPILTRRHTPAFTGSIEVDVTAEDLPTSDIRQTAEFGKNRVKNQLSATIYYRPPDPFNQWTNRLK